MTKHLTLSAAALIAFGAAIVAVQQYTLESSCQRVNRAAKADMVQPTFAQRFDAVNLAYQDYEGLRLAMEQYAKTLKPQGN